MIDLIIYLAVLVIVVCLAWYLLQQLPLPPEAQKFIMIAIVVIVGVIIIGLLLSLRGGGLHLGRLSQVAVTLVS